MNRAPSSASSASSRLIGLVLVLGGVFAGCGSAEDSRPAKWSFISPVIIQPSCATANCHSQLAERSGVTLDTVADGYQQLTQRHFVLPNDPDGSALMALLRGQGSRRMPPDFPLPEVDIELIGAWIADGANWDGPGSEPGPLPSPPVANSGAVQ
jgi:hypothetical protein